MVGGRHRRCFRFGDWGWSGFHATAVLISDSLLWQNEALAEMYKICWYPSCFCWNHKFCFVWRIWLYQTVILIYFSVLFNYCFFPPLLLFCSFLFLLSACAHQTRYQELAVALDSSNLTNKQLVTKIEELVRNNPTNQFDVVFAAPPCSLGVCKVMGSHGATRQAAYTALCKEQNGLSGKPVKRIKV